MAKRTSVDDPHLQLARASFSVFLGLVHSTDMPAIWDGKAVPAVHHQEMIKALVDDSLGHTLIVTPRGSGKTTLVQAWLEWQLGRASLSGNKEWANDFRVIYFSNTAHQAYRVSNAIKATIESNRIYQAIFPGIQPHKDKWSQEEWKVKGNTIKDSNFQALGVGGPALGSRALIIVFDDICDQENMATSYQRAQLIGSEDGSQPGWLDLTAVPILVPWGRMIQLCTRWAWNDGAAWAERAGWHKVYIKALTTDEETDEEQSYWEERFSTQWLKDLRGRKPRAFARSYQNEVTPEEGQTFLRDWFPRYDELPVDVGCRPTSWDTAAGQGRNRSYSAGWSACVTPDFHIYLKHLTRGQVLYPYLRRAVWMLAQREHATHVIIEKKSSGHQLVDEFVIMRAKGELPWQLVEWQPAGQKGSPTRFRYNEEITEFCEEGRVHLPSETFMRRQGGENWLPTAEEEIFSYPDSQQDDIVDALCQLIYWVKRQYDGKRLALLVPREPVLWARPTDERVRV